MRVKVAVWTLCVTLAGLAGPAVLCPGRRENHPPSGELDGDGRRLCADGKNRGHSGPADCRPPAAATGRTSRRGACNRRPKRCGIRFGHCLIVGGGQPPGSGLDTGGCCRCGLAPGALSQGDPHRKRDLRSGGPPGARSDRGPTAGRCPVVERGTETRRTPLAPSPSDRRERPRSAAFCGIGVRGRRRKTGWTRRSILRKGDRRRLRVVDCAVQRDCRGPRPRRSAARGANAGAIAAGQPQGRRAALPDDPRLALASLAVFPERHDPRPQLPSWRRSNSRRPSAPFSK